MGFFSLFDSKYDTQDELNRGGGGPQSSGQGFMGGSNVDTYEQRSQARNDSLQREFAQRKAAENQAEQAAFQKQANPLAPDFAGGLVATPPADAPATNSNQTNWEVMQRQIYGG